MPISMMLRVNARTDYTTILYQASVFNECRVFAPRYRTGKYFALFYNDIPPKHHKALDLAYNDLKLRFNIP